MAGKSAWAQVSVTGLNAPAGSWAEVADSTSEMATRYQAGSINSGTNADAALRDINRQRALIQAQHLKQEEACAPTFFTNNCLDKAQENRRAALAKLRPVEIEANAFKRHAKVEERDRELAAKQPKPGNDMSKEATATTMPAAASDESIGLDTGKGKARTAPRSPKKASKPTGLDSAAEARNMAAYDKKLAASAKRQKAVAARNALSEEKRRKKQAVPN